MDIHEMIEKRQEYNYKILDVLKQVIDKYPYWRFGQIISNLSIAARGKDSFYDESVETYENIPPIFRNKE